MRIFLSGAVVSAEAGAYGTKVRFQQSRPIEFEAFTISFLGERMVTPPLYPRGIRYYDFEVVSGFDNQKVTWSMGSGDITATRFEADGRRFLLELKMSDRLGCLKDDELVVTEMTDAQ
jgi:hypothetical protein